MDVQACAACLAMDVRMYSMCSGGLLQSYQRLSGREVDEMLPRQLCWECAALVNKFNVFRLKCERAYLQLRHLYSKSHTITKECIGKIDRDQNNLTSQYSISKSNSVGSVSVKPEQMSQFCRANTLESVNTHTMELDCKEVQNLVEPHNYYCGLQAADNSMQIVPIKKEKLNLERKSKCHLPKEKCERNRKCVRDIAECFKATRVALTQEEMMQTVSEREKTAGYREARFKCTLCYKGFMEDKTFSNHMRLHDPKSGELECDICKVRLRTRQQVHCHITSAHLLQYRCQLCPSVAPNKSSAMCLCFRSSAKKHYNWHQGVTYTCDICGAISSKLNTHLSHLRIKHPSQHICGDCGESFVSRRGLNEHAKKMHQTPPAGGAAVAGAYCAACDVHFSSKQIWTKHILISPKHESERAGIVNGCRHCGETFPSSAELARHARAHKPPRAADVAPRREPPVCVQCGEVQANPRAYWAHFRRSHPSDIYPQEARLRFVCELCGRRFKCNALLSTHRNVHKGVRNYKCSDCPKSFFKMECLRVHLITHSEFRPHECEMCNKGFKLKWQLKRHMRSHSSGANSAKASKLMPDKQTKALVSFQQATKTNSLI